MKDSIGELCGSGHLLGLCDSVCAWLVSLSSHSANVIQYCLCPRRRNLLVYTVSSEMISTKEIYADEHFLWNIRDPPRSP